MAETTSTPDSAPERSKWAYSPEFIENLRKMSSPFVSSHVILEPDELFPRLDVSIQRLRGIDFDTFAFSGASGIIAAPYMAYKMKKNMLLVRKPDDSTHSVLPVEGFYRAKRYVVVDDFTSSGKTLRRIIAGIKSVAPEAIFVGMVSYTSMTFKAPWELTFVLKPLEERT